MKKYSKVAILNLILGVLAIMLYLPFTLDAFNMPGSEWFEFVPKMLKGNYFNVLVYFGVGLIVWELAINIISLLSHCNWSKILFKVSAIVALVLPLIYVLSFKNDFMLELWVKTIAKEVKMISYIAMIASWGLFAWGIVRNITKKNHANFYHVLQALAMCVLLTLLVLTNGWCGWDMSLNVWLKMFGVLMAVFAVYFPVSAVLLFLYRNKRD